MRLCLIGSFQGYGVRFLVKGRMRVFTAVNKGFYFIQAAWPTSLNEPSSQQIDCWLTEHCRDIAFKK